MSSPALETALAGFLAEESLRLQRGSECSAVVIPAHLKHAERAYRIGWLESQINNCSSRREEAPTSPPAATEIPATSQDNGGTR